jgi:hypothetical protein
MSLLLAYTCRYNIIHMVIDKVWYVGRLVSLFRLILTWLAITPLCGVWLEYIYIHITY